MLLLIFPRRIRGTSEVTRQQHIHNRVDRIAEHTEYQNTTHTKNNGTTRVTHGPVRYLVGKVSVGSAIAIELYWLLSVSTTGVNKTAARGEGPTGPRKVGESFQK